MGIRIHKILGYGLTDVKAEDYDILDERFNLTDGFFKDRDEGGFTIEGFIEYLQEQYDKEKNEAGYSMITFDLFQLKDEKEKYDLYDLVCHNGEFGLPNVVVFSCPMKDWRRFDNIIDYVEDSETGQKNSFKIFNSSIYPYEFWMNKDTGESTFEVEGQKYHYLHIRQAFNMGFIDYDEDKLKIAGFNSIEEANEKVVPGVPEIIRHLCRYLKIFKDDKTIFDLKPMLYTYWS